MKIYKTKNLLFFIHRRYKELDLSANKKSIVSIFKIKPNQIGFLYACV